MCKDMRYNYSEEEWEARIKDRVETINKLLPMKDHHFDTDYAYFGCRLTCRKDGTGAESDLSRRYYYDGEDTDPDYDDMCAMLDTIIEVLKEARDHKE